MSYAGAAVAAMVFRELHEAEEADFEYVQVRVTAEALEGSPVTVPLTPERGRRIAPRIQQASRTQPEGLVSDHPDRWRELLIHPVDWAALKLWSRKKALEPPVVVKGGAPLLFGIRVETE